MGHAECGRLANATDGLGRFAWLVRLLAEDLFDLAEEAAGGWGVFDGDGFGELPQELLLLLGELGGRLHADFDDEVALAVGVQVGNALAAQLELLAALRAFGDLDGFDAFERVDLELGAERGLREADGNDAVEVVAIALEELVRP